MPCRAHGPAYIVEGFQSGHLGGAGPDALHRGDARRGRVRGAGAQRAVQLEIMGGMNASENFPLLHRGLHGAVLRCRQHRPLKANREDRVGEWAFGGLAVQIERIVVVEPTGVCHGPAPIHLSTQGGRGRSHVLIGERHE
ncbi:MAG: hypothetical protein NZ847_08470 [Acidobacteria bacterium]|nr:hypothetical protein [Acidobacteriota bacterium]